MINLIYMKSELKMKSKSVEQSEREPETEETVTESETESYTTEETQESTVVSTTDMPEKSFKQLIEELFVTFKNAFELSYHEQTYLYDEIERCKIHQTCSLLFSLFYVYVTLTIMEFTWKSCAQMSYIELLLFCYFFHKTSQYTSKISYNYLDHLSRFKPMVSSYVEQDMYGMSYLTPIDLTNNEDEETDETYETEETDEETGEEETGEEETGEEESGEEETGEEETGEEEEEDEETEQEEPEDKEATAGAEALTQLRLRRSSRSKNKTD